MDYIKNFHHCEMCASQCNIFCNEEPGCISCVTFASAPDLDVSVLGCIDEWSRQRLKIADGDVSSVVVCLISLGSLFSQLNYEFLHFLCYDGLSCNMFHSHNVRACRTRERREEENMKISRSDVTELDCVCEKFTTLYLLPIVPMRYATRSLLYKFYRNLCCLMCHGDTLNYRFVQSS